MPSPNHHFSCIIRHGERADGGDGKTETEVKNEQDPSLFTSPLTALGIEQATKTGKYFRSLGYQRIRIQCSPFLRTIMTATEIAKQLEISQV